MVLLAVMAGIAVTLGEDLIFAAALNRSVDLDEVDVFAQRAALTAIPFLYLALRPRRLPWFVAAAAAAAVHGWWLATGIAYRMGHQGGGVPVLGAVLMLLSPFAILVLAGALDVAASRRANGS